MDRFKINPTKTELRVPTARTAQIFARIAPNRYFLRLKKTGLGLFRRELLLLIIAKMEAQT